MTTLDVMQIRDVGGQTGDVGLSVSPNGAHLAFEMHQPDLRNDTYRVAWFIASAHQPSAPVNVGDAGDPELFRLTEASGYRQGAWIPETAAWLPDSSAIVYRRKVGGAIQVWLSSLSGSQQQLTANAADVESFSLSADGSKLLFATDAPRAERRRARAEAAREGYLFQADTPMSFSGDLYFSRYALLGGKPRIWTYEIETRTERPASTEEVAEFQRLLSSEADELRTLGYGARYLARTRDGNSVAWLAPASPDKTGVSPPLALFASRKSDGPIRCAAAECTGYFSGAGGNVLWWSPDAAEVYFVTRYGPNLGRSAWFRWQIASNEVQRVLETSEDRISNCTFVHPKAICFRETPTHPRVIASIDLHTGSITTLVDPNPEMRNLKVGSVDRLEWSDSLGRSTFGLLIKPLDYARGERFPLVIVGYKAFGAIQGGTGHEYPAHVFAANGLGVLLYDAPEDWEVEATAGDVLERVRRVWEGEAVEISATHHSLKSIIDELDRGGLIDPSRIAISGFSTGNSQANYALANTDTFAAAALSGAPWTPMAYNLNQVGAVGRKFYRAVGLGPPTTPQGKLWKRLALTENVARMNTPVLINASDDEHLLGRDTVVTFADAGKPIVEMHVYPDENHVKWSPNHRLSVYNRNVDWFRFWLQGVEDKDPRKVEQYARWRAMRQVVQEARDNSAN